MARPKKQGPDELTMPMAPAHPDPAEGAVADDSNEWALPPDDAAVEPSGARYRTGDSYAAVRDEGLTDPSVPAGGGDAPFDTQNIPEEEQRAADKRRKSSTRVAQVSDLAPATPDDADATSAGAPVKLEVTEGPDVGKKKRMVGVRFVIGRAPGLEWVLSDPSVSRRHAELVRGDDGVWVRDLGAGNGTRVNGEKVTEVKLEHGDEIVIGKTTILFFDEVAAFAALREKRAAKAVPPKPPSDVSVTSEPVAEAVDGDEGSEEGEGDAEAEADDAAEGEEAPSVPVVPPSGWAALPLATKGVAVASLLITLVALVAGGVLLSKRNNGAKAKLEEIKYLLPLAQANAANENYAAAKEALTKLEALLQDPEVRREAQSFAVEAEKARQTVSLELDASRWVTQAKEAVAEKKWDDAQTLLVQIPDESRYRSLRDELQKELEQGSLKSNQEQMESLFGARELESAQQLLDVFPAVERKNYEERLRRLAVEVELDRAKSEKDRERERARVKEALKVKRAREVEDILRPVQRRFAASDWGRVPTECDRVAEAHAGDKDLLSRINDIKSLLPPFSKAYEEGVRKFKAGQVVPAAKTLRRARQLYQQIGLEAPFGATLDDDFTQSVVAEGRDALSRGDLAQAYKSFAEALSVNAKDSRAKKGFEDAEARARDQLSEAEGKKAKNRAEGLKLLSKLIEATPAESPTHRLAVQRKTEWLEQ